MSVRVLLGLRLLEPLLHPLGTRSTRRANASRCRFSRKYDATPDITNAITTAHSTGTWSATSSQTPKTTTRQVTKRPIRIAV